MTPPPTQSEQAVAFLPFSTPLVCLKCREHALAPCRRSPSRAYFLNWSVPQRHVAGCRAAHQAEGSTMLFEPGFAMRRLCRNPCRRAPSPSRRAPQHVKAEPLTLTTLRHCFAMLRRDAGIPSSRACIGHDVPREGPRARTCAPWPCAPQREAKG
jgi:hypothetical protein